MVSAMPAPRRPLFDDFSTEAEGTAAGCRPPEEEQSGDGVGKLLRTRLQVCGDGMHKVGSERDHESLTAHGAHRNDLRPLLRPFSGAVMDY